MAQEEKLRLRSPVQDVILKGLCAAVLLFAAYAFWRLIPLLGTAFGSVNEVYGDTSTTLNALKFVILPLAVLAVLWLVYSLFGTFFESVRLSRDAIISKGLFRKKIIPLGEINDVQAGKVSDFMGAEDERAQAHILRSLLGMNHQVVVRYGTPEKEIAIKDMSKTFAERMKETLEAEISRA